MGNPSPPNLPLEGEGFCDGYRADLNSAAQYCSIWPTSSGGSGTSSSSAACCWPFSSAQVKNSRAAALRRASAGCSYIRMKLVAVIGHACSPGALVMTRLKSCKLPQSAVRSEEHTSELQSLMRISYAVFCLKKKKKKQTTQTQ